MKRDTWDNEEVVPMLRVSDVARLLNVHVNTIRRWNSQGILKAHRIGSRGDRRLSCPLETAYRNGARFDSWDECFSYGLYLDAFKQHNLDPAFYSQRERPADESFPWDHLAGDNKKQLHQRLQQIIKVPGGSENK